jgi:colicin import membrane protein
MAVTKEQIFEAADQIAANGQRPTLEAVRQMVGGSYTTISPALNTWKSRQKGTPLREAAPQAVAERLGEVGADIWGMASNWPTRAWRSSARPWRRRAPTWRRASPKLPS